MSLTQEQTLTVTFERTVVTTKDNFITDPVTVFATETVASIETDFMTIEHASKEFRYETIVDRSIVPTTVYTDTQETVPLTPTPYNSAITETVQTINSLMTTSLSQTYISITSGVNNQQMSCTMTFTQRDPMWTITNSTSHTGVAHGTTSNTSSFNTESSIPASKTCTCTNEPCSHYTNYSHTATKPLVTFPYSRSTKTFNSCRSEKTCTTAGSLLTGVTLSTQSDGKVITITRTFTIGAANPTVYSTQSLTDKNSENGATKNAIGAERNTDHP